MRRSTFLLLLAVAACSRTPSEQIGATPEPSPTNSAPVASPLAPPAMNGHGMSHPPIPSAAPRGPLALHWDDPPRWQRRVPSTPMRAVEYRIPRTGSDTEDGECFVITFGQGQGGSVDDNIDRWVKQLQPTSSGVERGKRTVNGMTVTRVEVSGTYTAMAMPGMPSSGGPKAGWRLVGDIVEAPSGMWFFKLVGPDATAKAAGKELDALIDTVRPS